MTSVHRINVGERQYGVGSCEYRHFDALRGPEGGALYDALSYILERYSLAELKGMQGKVRRRRSCEGLCVQARIRRL